MVQSAGGGAGTNWRGWGRGGSPWATAAALTPVHTSGSPSRFLFLQCSQLGLSPTVVGLGFGNEEDFYFPDNLCRLLTGRATRCLLPVFPWEWPEGVGSQLAQGISVTRQGKKNRLFLFWVLSVQCRLSFPQTSKSLRVRRDLGRDLIATFISKHERDGPFTCLASKSHSAQGKSTLLGNRGRLPYRNTHTLFVSLSLSHIHTTYHISHTHTHHTHTHT